jgi:hypothetical protein
MKLTGRCYCGDIKYAFEGDVQSSLQCHCRECQYISGGSPNVAMVLPESGFGFTQGTPQAFARSDLETPVTRYFCPRCGTSLGTRSPKRPGSFIVKVGTLDDPSIFKPRVAIFTIDKQPFHHIAEGLPAFERRPT